MKGRNSSCINIRLKDEDMEKLTKKALDKGYETPGTYVKSVILKSLRSDSTTATAIIPIYNKDIHKAGDKVLIKQGKVLVEAIVPEIDAEGNKVPEY